MSVSAARLLGRATGDGQGNTRVAGEGLLQGVIDDATQRYWVRLACLVACLSFSGEAAALFLTSWKVSDKLDAMLDPAKPDDTPWEDILTLPLFVTVGICLALYTLRLALILKHGGLRYIDAGARFILVGFEVAGILVPGRTYISGITCSGVDCDRGGGEISGWMRAWGVYHVVYWPLVLFIRSYKRNARLSDEQTAEDQPGQRAPGKSQQEEVIKEDEAPIVLLFQLVRDIWLGVVLFASSSGVRDRINRATDASWTSVLAALLVAYSVGTFLSFAMLLSMGCPTALQRRERIKDSLGRALWNCTVPLIFALCRLGFLMLLMFSAEFTDRVRYWDYGHLRTGLVVVWVRYFFGLSALSAVLALVCALRPSWLEGLSRASRTSKMHRNFRDHLRPTASSASQNSGSVSQSAVSQSAVSLVTSGQTTTAPATSSVSLR